MSFRLLSLLLVSSVALADTSDLDQWLISDARQALIDEFEENDCRLTLTEVSDILFDFDVSDEQVYKERLVWIEPEAGAFTFPVLLAKGEFCGDVPRVPIVVPAGALDYVKQRLTEVCRISIDALESLDYPEEIGVTLTDTQRRDIVSELYNQQIITFSYRESGGLKSLFAFSVEDVCTE